MSNDRPSLDAIGERLGLDQASSGHGYLATLEQELRPLEKQAFAIVIISGEMPIDTANAFAEFYPAAQVNLIVVRSLPESERERAARNVFVSVCSEVEEMHAVLLSVPRVDVLIEDGTNKKSQKLQCFRELFFHLADGGLYVVEDLHACFLNKYADCDGEDVWRLLCRLSQLKLLPKERLKGTSSDDLCLSAAVERIAFLGKLALVRKKGEHLYKLRDTEASALFPRLPMASSYSETTIEPPQTFVSRAKKVWTSRPDFFASKFRRKMDVPAIQLHEYHDVTCRPGQIAQLGRVLLPDTFRAQRYARLGNKHTCDNSFHFASLKDAGAPVQRLSGCYLYLDTEYPTHYGHISTEVLSRLWGWDEAVRRFGPGLKVLVSSLQPGQKTPGYERAMFNAHGIADENIVCINGPVVVERLITATPKYHLRTYVAPSILSTWGRLRDNLELPLSEYPEKLFISRDDKYHHRCKNRLEVEARFVEHGFVIVHPETRPLGEQVALFAHARVVAGFAGTGTLNAIYGAPGKTKIVIESETFRAKNDYLIASVLEDDFYCFWCPAEIAHPKGGWSLKAYLSDFSFDFDKDGEALTQLLESV